MTITALNNSQLRMEADVISLISMMASMYMYLDSDLMAGGGWVVGTLQTMVDAVTHHI